jgi:hypothetical protein
MGGAVSSFVGNVAKTVAKGATTALGGMIPVVGPALAQGVNSLYKKGGKVMPRFEAGGEVPAGFKAKVINTPAQLISVIKQFPAEAAKANLSVQDVKDAIAELKAPAMARGGRAMARGGMARGGMCECMEMPCSCMRMADGGMVMGRGVSAPLPAPYNPGPPGRGQMMMYGRGGEPSMAMGGMSGQRAMARGRGGF